MANSAYPAQMLQNMVSDQGLQFAHKIFHLNFDKNENTTQQPFKQKLTGPIDNSWKFHLA